MANKKVVSVLSTAAIGTLIATAVGSTVFAAVDGLVVKNASGAYLNYDLDALKASVINDALGQAGAELYKDFDVARTAGSMVSYHDNKVGFVDVAAVNKAALDAALAGTSFDLNTFAESSKETVLPATVFQATVTNGKVVAGAEVKPTTAATTELKVASVSAINGKLTVTLTNTPETTPTVADFAVKASINGAAEETIASTGISVSGKIVTLTVPMINQKEAAQNVVYKVAYKTTAAVSGSLDVKALPKGPRVLSTTPAEGKDVTGNTITVTFAAAVNTDTFNATNVKLFNVTENKYEPLTFNTADPKIPLITAVNGLNGNLCKYVLTISNVADLTGLVMEDAYTLNFVDGAVAAMGAGTYDGNLNVWGRMTSYQGNQAFRYEANFTEDIDPSTVNKTNVTLVNAATNKSADYEVRIDGRRLVVTLNKDLDENADYVLTVNDKVTTTLGIPLNASVIRRFHTRDLTAPTVVKVTPAEGTTGVATNASLEIELSESVTGLVLDTADGLVAAANDTVALKNNGTNTFVNLAANYSISPKVGTDNKVWILKPNTGITLAADSSYTLTLRGKKNTNVGRIIDTTTTPANELESDYTVSFTTGKADSVAPKVTKVMKVNPDTSVADIASGVKNILLNRDLRLVFDDQLTVSGGVLPTGAAILKDLKSGATYDISSIAAVTNNAAANTAVVDININAADIDATQAGNQTVAGDTNYELTLTTNLQDNAANPIDTYKFNFTTSSGDDGLALGAVVTPLGVETQSYAFTADTVADKQYSIGDAIVALKDATGVKVDSPIVLQFKDDMIGLDTAGNIKVTYKDSTGAVKDVEGTITLVGTKTAMFKPAAKLANSTVYTVTVASTVTDEAGNNSVVTGTETVNFKTEAVANNPAVTFSGVTTSVFEKNNLDTAITLTFSGDVTTGGGANAADLSANYVLDQWVDANNDSIAQPAELVGAPIVVRPVVKADGKTVVLYPNTALVNNVRYAVVVGNNVLVGGAALSTGTTYVANFTNKVDFYTKATAVMSGNQDNLGIQTATYNASTRVLTLTLDRPVFTGSATAVTPVDGADLTKGNAVNNLTVTGGSLVIVGAPAVSADGLTVSMVLHATNGGIAPGITTIAPAAGLKFVDTAGNNGTFGTTPITITVAQ